MPPYNVILITFKSIVTQYDEDMKDNEANAAHGEEKADEFRKKNGFSNDSQFPSPCSTRGKLQLLPLVEGDLNHFICFTL